MGTPGGAYFEFVPTTLSDPEDPPITNLTDSPFVSGDVFGLRLGKRAANTDYDQGTQTGLCIWIPEWVLLRSTCVPPPRASS